MKKIFATLAALVLSLSFGACSNDFIKPNENSTNKETPENTQTPDDPNTPPQEDPETPTEKVEHNVARIEVVLVDGHLHGTYGFHENLLDPKIKHIRQVQKLTYVPDEEGNFVLADNSPNKVANHTKNDYHDTDGGGSVLGTWIHYYDSEGNEITGDFATNKHQHFFTVKDAKPNFDGTAESVAGKSTKNFFAYVYGDSSPWNSRLHDGAPLVGDTDPRGLKGYFSFLIDRVNYNVVVNLVVVNGKKSVEGFDTPLPGGQVLSFTIPVNVYATQKEYLEGETMDEVNENEADKRYLKAVATAYNITEEEALEELNLVVWGNAPKHSDDGYWF